MKMYRAFFSDVGRFIRDHWIWLVVAIVLFAILPWVEALLGFIGGIIGVTGAKEAKRTVRVIRAKRDHVQTFKRKERALDRLPTHRKPDLGFLRRKIRARKDRPKK